MRMSNAPGAQRGRDVHELSTMKRVCGGEGGFASQSPAVILARALEREGALQPGHQSWAGLQVRAAMQGGGVKRRATGLGSGGH